RPDEGAGLTTTLRLLRAVEPVSRVAQAGDDVPLLVQLPVDRRDDDPYIGMLADDVLDPFGRRDQRNQQDVRRTRALDRADRGRGRVPGREHRVEQDHVARGDVVRELDVVLDRLERLLVAVEADETDARSADEREHAV